MSISQSKIVLLNLMELCAALFRGPDERGWRELATHGLPELLGRVQDFPAFPAAPLKALRDGLAPYVETEDFSPLEAEYVRLFIAGPGGVPAPLYESCHQADAPRTMGQSALAMRDRLTEAGLEISLDSNEPPDHLALELEYLFHLCAEGWTNDPALADKAILFAAKDMTPWVARFREALAGAAPDPVYLAGADTTLTLLSKLGSLSSD
ncbi:molecular chaperone TorD family protein [uncultured Pseudodesulfovibrio sp.]|uniref:TorD/DmsD family molecular chaperone n=1 Tax=uncultured Pseudodesulfovibrio sp. TaxID=2035858 RepID=UPI0029C7481F|nr:molecular chaperone TorD family protein [uncultured Pseudodesulfovibrio sp.]